MLTKQLLPLGVFILILFFLWRGLDSNPNQLPSELINKPVPKFSLQALASDTPIITEDIFKGHISLVNVWASWCSNCATEHALITRLDKIDKLQLVGINYKDTRNNADLWLNKFGNPYTVNIFDAEGSLGIDLGVYGTPTTYIIDHYGIIRYRHVGILTNEVWNKIIISEITKLKMKV